MSIQTLLPAYDFTICTRLSPQERVTRCVNEIKIFQEEGDYHAFEEMPTVPPLGATEEELQALENTLGVSLPEDYRVLLRHHRYIVYNQGVNIYGLDYQGTRICGSPFVIKNFFTPGQFLAIGDFWCFADGDHLLIALDEENQPVYAYFHEQGPRTEYFAPNVTSALWRLVFEKNNM